MLGLCPATGRGTAGWVKLGLMRAGTRSVVELAGEWCGWRGFARLWEAWPTALRAIWSADRGAPLYVAENTSTCRSAATTSARRTARSKTMILFPLDKRKTASVSRGGTAIGSVVDVKAGSYSLLIWRTHAMISVSVPQFIRWHACADTTP